MAIRHPVTRRCRAKRDSVERPAVGLLRALWLPHKFRQLRHVGRASRSDTFSVICYVGATMDWGDDAWLSRGMDSADAVA